MLTVKELTIKDIEKLTENEAAELAEDRAEIKEHTVYFADFPGCFGYSALVFKDGHHIYYANDYELHHQGKTRQELRAWYEKALSHKLYTEAELAEPLKSYDEYKSKSYFLFNYYGMRRDYVTIFCINPSKDRQDEFERKTAKMVYDPIAFAYMEDEDFVKHRIELFNILEQRYSETSENYEYQKSAFYYELGNHEYHINTYQGDWDTLSAFGDIQWHGQGREARELYFDELGFNEVKRRAFEDARREFLRDARENDWY